MLSGTRTLFYLLLLSEISHTFLFFLSLYHFLFLKEFYIDFCMSPKTFIAVRTWYFLCGVFNFLFTCVLTNKNGHLSTVLETRSNDLQVSFYTKDFSKAFDFKCITLFVLELQDLGAPTCLFLPLEQDYFRFQRIIVSLVKQLWRACYCKSSSRLKIVNNWCERIWAIKYPRVYQILRRFRWVIVELNRTNDLKTGDCFISFKS